MKHKIYSLLAGVALLAPGMALLAHHSPSAIFDMKKPVTLTGTMTKVDWVNPHIVMFMDVKNADGTVTNWKFESNPPRWFTKVGVTRADFAQAVGQEVKCGVVTAIDGSKYGYLQRIEFANGNKFQLDEAQTKDQINP